METGSGPVGVQDVHQMSGERGLGNTGSDDYSASRSSCPRAIAQGVVSHP